MKYVFPLPHVLVNNMIIRKVSQHLFFPFLNLSPVSSPLVGIDIDLNVGDI
jgi:hypothetical protein